MLGSAGSRRPSTSRPPRYPPPRRQSAGPACPSEKKYPYTCCPCQGTAQAPVAPQARYASLSTPRGASNGEEWRKAGRRGKGAWGSSVGQAPEPCRTKLCCTEPCHGKPCHAARPLHPRCPGPTALPLPAGADPSCHRRRGKGEWGERGS